MWRLALYSYVCVYIYIYTRILSKTCKKPRSQANQRKQNKTSRPRSDIDIGTQKLRPHKRSNPWPAARRKQQSRSPFDSAKQLRSKFNNSPTTYVKPPVRVLKIWFKHNSAHIRLPDNTKVSRRNYPNNVKVFDYIRWQKVIKSTYNNSAPLSSMPH